MKSYPQSYQQLIPIIKGCFYLEAVKCFYLEAHKYILILKTLLSIVGERKPSTLWTTCLCSLSLTLRSIPLSRNFQDFKHRCFPVSRPPLSRRPCELVINYITRFLCATASRWEGMVYRVGEDFKFV